MQLIKGASFSHVLTGVPPPDPQAIPTWTMCPQTKLKKYEFPEKHSISNYPCPAEFVYFVCDILEP